MTKKGNLPQTQKDLIDQIPGFLGTTDKMLSDRDKEPSIYQLTTSDLIKKLSDHQQGKITLSADELQQIQDLIELLKRSISLINKGLGV